MIRTANPPETVADILRGAAREMGADIYEPDAARSAGGDIDVVLHGEESGGIWAVRVCVRGICRGSCMELVALGGGLPAEGSSVDRRDLLADRLRG